MNFSDPSLLDGLRSAGSDRRSGFSPPTLHTDFPDDCLSDPLRRGRSVLFLLFICRCKYFAKVDIFLDAGGYEPGLRRGAVQIVAEPSPAGTAGWCGNVACP